MMSDHTQYSPQVQQEVPVDDLIKAVEIPADTPEMDLGSAGQESVNTPEEDWETPAEPLEEVRTWCGVSGL